MFVPLLLSLSLWVPAPVLGETGPDAALKSQVTQALTKLQADAVFKGLKLGASVQCDGKQVAALDADALMYPASSAKLLSTAAALLELPTDHRFTTAVVGERKGNVLTRAALVAGGDPALTVEGLEDLAEQVKKLGIDKLDGLLVDLGYFAGSATAPAFDQKNTDAAYRPEVPALAVHSAAFTVTVRPGAKIGDPVRVTIGPVAAGIRIDSSAKTLEGKRLDKLVIEARADGQGTRVIVSGGLGVAADAQGVKKRLYGAAHVAALTFAQALKSRGLEVGPLTLGTADGALPIVARFQSPTVAAIAAQINKTSNNFMAEALFLQLGGKRPGERGATWEAAQARTTQALLGLGLKKTAFQVVNGSGLYEATRVSADGLATLLSAMNPSASRQKTSPEVRKAFWDSLAIAGTDGTLSHRLKGLENAARGKTGTLDRALSLSGYVDHPRCRLAFAVIANGALSKGQAKIVARFDQLVRELAGTSSKRSTDGKSKRRK